MKLINSISLVASCLGNRARFNNRLPYDSSYDSSSFDASSFDVYAPDAMMTHFDDSFALQTLEGQMIAEQIKSWTDADWTHFFDNLNKAVMEYESAIGNISLDSIFE